MSSNNLYGRIPMEIGTLKKLEKLSLNKNNYSGEIPSSIWNISSLSILSMGYNYLEGKIPEEIGKLKSLSGFAIGANKLSGELPSSLYNLSSLAIFFAAENQFHGSLPSDMFSNLISLQEIGIGGNQISEGKVPLEGVFKDATAISIVGNNKLCGGVLQLHLAPCPANVMARSNHHNLKLGIIVICVVVCLILLSIVVFLSKKKKRTSSLTASTNQLSMVSYQILHHSTQGFSTSNLIGSGSFGSVYKGFLESEHKFVAIKVINLQMSGAHKSFIAECNALKFIRHRNLVKILTCCSSIDYSGQEFKALVFEYMPNGSLEKWLHPSAEITDRLYTLDLTQRLNIVVDVASALHYLHYGCEQPVVHCDLKPENVLLDDDMVAHVTDFGLARLLSVTNGDPHNQSSTTVFKGTIGYAPPEYGMSCEVSMQGDVYSFGILVLEMVTGRRPMEEMFKDDNNLHNYVKMAYSHNLLEIMDSTLLPKQTGKEEKYTKKLTMCVFSLIRIGLACSVESPNERMNMADVTRELNLTKDVFLQD
ncbi:probable LRR receptor-like serine/threonine-protein kinase At3g47570 isoform X2 [Arachis hypogaea]|uniref:probable LRR receptor-like serine/threonine-protein kinase At3g47570 isoform X2 n=1 Tax=Arachis hypogaea TaxID=3818 RepID=UPI003B2108CD|nr:putative LRR receptor-like serine/threonine-protein kinase [Arachis hypogaea]